jgi:hypothetical protein
MVPGPRDRGAAPRRAGRAAGRGGAPGTPGPRREPAPARRPHLTARRRPARQPRVRRVRGGDRRSHPPPGMALEDRAADQPGYLAGSRRHRPVTRHLEAITSRRSSSGETVLARAPNRTRYERRPAAESATRLVSPGPAGEDRFPPFGAGHAAPDSLNNGQHLWVV